MNIATTTRSATARQLRYLRVLAEQTGTTFVPPRSSAEASREIHRLAELRATRGRHVELPDEEDGEGRRGSYGTELHPESGAPSTRAEAPPRPAVGRRTELARYTAAGEERVLYGQRVDGSVRLTDRPRSGCGRAYLIERGVERDGYAALLALVAEYVQRARELDQVPMRTSELRQDLLSAPDAR